MEAITKNESTDVKIKEAVNAVVEDCVRSNADLGTIIYEIESVHHDFKVKVTFQVKRKYKKNERAAKPELSKRIDDEAKIKNGKGGGDIKKPKSGKPPL